MVFEFNVAAMNAVIVVPMFAPIMNGAASFNVAIFLATMGTTTDVVIVLERIAAVVINPHANDLSGFLKKKRLNLSGDLAARRSEINFLNIRIEIKSKVTAISANKKGLLTDVIRKSMRGPKPDQKCDVVFSVGLLTGLKNKSETHNDIEDRNP